jgi:membrane protease YdiL (CAAX protease family)
MNGPPVDPVVTEGHWGIRHVAAGLGIGLAVTILVQIALAAFGDLDSGDEYSLEAISLFQVALWVGLFGVPVWLVSSRGVDWSAFGLALERRDIFPGLALGLGAQVILVPALYYPILLFRDDLDVSADARELVAKADGLGVALLVLVVVIGAPVVEELFFRGLALRAFEQRLGRRLGLGVSALVFGLVHFQPLQFPALAMFGLIAGWLAQRDGRLGRAIWAHVGFNAWTVGVLLWM